MRQAWISPEESVSVLRQCALVGVSRATYYAHQHPQPVDEDEALIGVPEIFNTDQGAQFTSHDFINVLKVHPIRISMDGRGRAADNIFVERLWRTVKYEDIYLKDYQTLAQVYGGLKTYFSFYNGERRHQSLGHQTPDAV